MNAENSRKRQCLRGLGKNEHGGSVRPHEDRYLRRTGTEHNVVYGVIVQVAGIIGAPVLDAVRKIDVRRGGASEVYHNALRAAVKVRHEDAVQVFKRPGVAKREAGPRRQLYLLLRPEGGELLSDLRELLIMRLKQPCALIIPVDHPPATLIVIRDTQPPTDFLARIHIGHSDRKQHRSRYGHRPRDAAVPKGDPFLIVVFKEPHEIGVWPGQKSHGRPAEIQKISVERRALRAWVVEIMHAVLVERPVIGSVDASSPVPKLR